MDHTIDILDPDFHVGDPHPTYRRLRRHDPLGRDRNGFLLVTLAEHIREVERRSAEFVSSQGYRSVWHRQETSMISQDDPRHLEQRRIISDRFTPRTVADLEGEVRDLVDEALDLAGVGVTRQIEVVDALAARIPAILTCRLIGWPDSQWRDVRSWSERLMRVDTMRTDPGQLADGIRAVNEIASLTAATVPQRRGCPADDLLARWANGTVDGAPMSDEQIESELGLVIPGGAETTRTTMARALILFSERNDLWEHLADDPGRIPAAVEELLRWITPLNNMFRTAAVDTELDGVDIAAGDRIALVYPSANRDERVFDDPDEVILDRDPNPHLSFGIGTHFCLGAHVARLVVRVMLEQLTARLTDLHPAAPPRYETNVFVKAVHRFDLGYRPR